MDTIILAMMDDGSTVSPRLSPTEGLHSLPRAWMWLGLAGEPTSQLRFIAGQREMALMSGGGARGPCRQQLEAGHLEPSSASLPGGWVLSDCQEPVEVELGRKALSVFCRWASGCLWACSSTDCFRQKHL